MPTPPSGHGMIFADNKLVVAKLGNGRPNVGDAATSNYRQDVAPDLAGSLNITLVPSLAKKHHSEGRQD